jgi:hypothetical protein
MLNGFLFTAGSHFHFTSIIVGDSIGSTKWGVCFFLSTIPMTVVGAVKREEWI